MSLVSLLSIARSALRTHQRSMAVTANNIANAQTSGYSRQRLQLVASSPLRTPQGTFGTGVEDLGTQRARDRLLDGVYWRESGFLGSSGAKHDVLSQIEALLGEPSEAALGATMDQMFRSFSDLAANPANGTTRDLVRMAAGRFTDQMHRLDTQLGQLRQDATERLTAQVAQVNELSRRIADLNTQILSAGGPNAQAPDLQDQRDALIDQLSSLVSVRVLTRDDGTIGVLSGQLLLVDGSSSHPLEVRAGVSGFEVGSVGGNDVIDLGAGSISALTDLLNVKIATVQGDLDGLAKAMVVEVNAIHNTGYTLNGTTGIDFFDANGVTARSIALDSRILGSTDAIAAAGTNAPGDGAIAIRLGGLATTGVATLSGRSLREFYNGIVSSVGQQTADAARDVEARVALVDTADARRSSLSGVSVDEEMVNLLSQQQAYNAAARLIQTASEMIDDLLKMV